MVATPQSCFRRSVAPGSDLDPASGPRTMDNHTAGWSSW